MQAVFIESHGELSEACTGGWCVSDLMLEPLPLHAEVERYSVLKVKAVLQALTFLAQVIPAIALPIPSALCNFIDAVVLGCPAKRLACFR